MVSLELKGCGVLSEAYIDCPLLTSLDASFCRWVLLLWLYLVISLARWGLVSTGILYTWFMQPTKGWLFICYGIIMSTHRIIGLNVMLLCRPWWTFIFALSSELDLPWSVLYFFGQLAAGFLLMRVFKGNTFILLLDIKSDRYKAALRSTN